MAAATFCSRSCDSVAVEQILGRPVTAGRLFTAPPPAGSASESFPERCNRRAGIEALEIIDRAIELGFLPPAPAERACTWCDFRVVCGADEHRHAARKAQEPLGDSIGLREKP